MRRSPSVLAGNRRWRGASVLALVMASSGVGSIEEASAAPVRGPVVVAENGAALDVNDYGVIVGSYQGSDGTAHAFRWARGRLTDLGLGVANAVNDQGIVVGQLHDRATVWYPDGTPHDLGLGDGSSVSDINRSGTMVGGFVPASGEARAFVLDPGADEPVILPPAPVEGAGSGYPVAINAAGTIAGEFYIDGWSRPMVWLAGTHEPVVLEETAITSSVRGISDRGTIVGSSVDDRGYKAVVWRAPDYRQVEVGEPGTESLGRGINDRDQVVGVSYQNGPFRWDPRSGRTTILTGLGDFAAGHYSEAWAINDHGMTVGYSSPEMTGPSHAIIFGDG